MEPPHSPPHTSSSGGSDDREEDCATLFPKGVSSALRSNSIRPATCLRTSSGGRIILKLEKHAASDLTPGEHMERLSAQARSRRCLYLGFGIILGHLSAALSPDFRGLVPRAFKRRQRAGCLPSGRPLLRLQVGVQRLLSLSVSFSCGESSAACPCPCRPLLRREAAPYAGALHQSHISRPCKHAQLPCPCRPLPRREAAPHPGGLRKTPTSRPWYHPLPGCSLAEAAVSATAPPPGLRRHELHAGAGYLHGRRHQLTPASLAEAEALALEGWPRPRRPSLRALLAR